MTEQSCLTWANHGRNIVNHLQSLRNKELFIDSTIVCNGKYFPAHRLVLSSCSSYFEGILAKVPCQHPFLIMNDVDSKDLEALLNFMYKGKATVVMDRLVPLLKAGKALRIKGLETFSDPPSTSTSPNAETSQGEKRIPSSLSTSPKQEFEGTQLSPKSLIDQCLGFEQQMKVEVEECAEEDPPASPPSLRLEHIRGGGSIPRCALPMTSCTAFAHGEETSSGRDPNTTTTKHPRGRSASQESSLYQFEDDLNDRIPKRRKTVSTRFCFDMKAFTCPMCSYGTKYRGDLRKHLRTHTGEKPFTCGKCPFMTSDSSSLKNHMRSHNGEKPFRCAACSFSTTNQATLKKHLKIHSTSTQQNYPPPADDYSLLEHLGLFRQGCGKPMESEAVL